MATLFVNGRLFTGREILDGRALLVEDGVIREIVPAGKAVNGAERVDLGGGLLAPGFIDLQVNGAGGVLFNDDPSVETLEVMIAAHRRFGTTTLLPTLVSDVWEKMVQAAEAVREGVSRKLPGLRGVHFEGPYVNPERKGIHLEQYIRDVDSGAVELLGQGGMGRVVATVAPEKVSAGYIKALVEKGVLVCAGHTAADYDTAMAGIDAGIRGFTHLFNAMTPMHSREPGVVGAALSHEQSWCGIIADGFHIHYATLKVAVRAKPRGKMMLVTDSMPSLGAEENSFMLQGREIFARDGRCVAQDGVLAGADLDMATAVRNTRDHLGLPLEEALRMASLYPAEFLALDYTLGKLKPGYEADLVLLDENLEVRGTWIHGQ